MNRTMRQGLDIQTSSGGIGFAPASPLDSPGDQSAPIYDSNPQEQRDPRDRLGQWWSVISRPQTVAHAGHATLVKDEKVHSSEANKDQLDLKVAVYL